MAKSKVDGVVEAVHYKPGGEVDWVRLYQRRGAIFSDHILVDRPTFIQHLRAGKRYVVGRRLPYLASTFEISQPVRLVRLSEKEALVVGEAQADHDRLEGVPVL